jgi:medium-chain acyl-[acyl-carrier-protein] hydrolase
MHQMEDVDFVEEIGRRYGGVPLEILQDPEILSLLLPGMRADVTLLETYQYVPEAPLECPITAFGGSQDRMVTQESINEWREETSGRFQMNLLMGDHFLTQSAKLALLRTISEEAKSLKSLP